MPAAIKPRTAIPQPKTEIISADAIGNHRWMSGASNGNRDIVRPAQTATKPMAMRTAAKPMLKATIKYNPKAVRCNATALRSTTKAAGHGTIPPVTPRTSNCREKFLCDARDCPLPAPVRSGNCPGHARVRIRRQYSAAKIGNNPFRDECPGEHAEKRIQAIRQNVFLRVECDAAQ